MFYLSFLDYVVANSGAVGSAVELAVKSYLFGKTVKTVQSKGKTDAYFTVFIGDSKRKVTVEVKTACGRIDHCSKSQYIVYWPEPMEDASVEHSAVVFSREQWEAFVNGYTGRGKFVNVRKDGEAHIQSFRGLLSGVRPAASVPIAEYIYSVCDTMPTLAEWKAAMGRG